MDILWWHWLVFGGFLLILEMFAGTFAFLIFAISSPVPMIMSLLGCNLIWQIAGFAVCVFIVFLIFRNNPNIWASSSQEKFGSDQLLEKEGTVIQTESLKVNVNGEVWSAVAENGEILNIGDKVTVCGIKGVKLTVKREEN